MRTFEELMHYLDDIPANYWNNTFEMLYKYVPTLPTGEFLEFGTGLARATCMIALCNPDLKITTFDTAEPYNFEDYNAHIEETLQKHGVTQNVNHFIADSLEVKTDKEFVGINIDSGHSYDLTSKELLVWTPKLKKNGLVFLDDYLDDRVEVKAAVDNFLGTYGDEWEILNNQMCFVMKKL